MEFKFIGTIKDFEKIIERLKVKYPKETLFEGLIKEYGGKEEVIIC